MHGLDSFSVDYCLDSHRKCSSNLSTNTGILGEYSFCGVCIISCIIPNRKTAGGFEADGFEGGIISDAVRHASFEAERFIELEGLLPHSKVSDEGGIDLFILVQRCFGEDSEVGTLLENYFCELICGSERECVGNHDQEVSSCLDGKGSSFGEYVIVVDDFHLSGTYRGIRGDLFLFLRLLGLFSENRYQSFGDALFVHRKV